MILEFCKVQTEGKLLIVTLNRPDVFNSLHWPAHRELEIVFDDFRRNGELCAAIITGAGDRAFSAGNDLKYDGPERTWGLPERGFAGLSRRVDIDKPIIAAVNGLAVGGGFELALACDIVIAAEHATFSLPEPRVGLAALAGGLQRLPRQIGLKNALGLILTSRRVTAQQGFSMGFVNEVVPRGEALNVARVWASEILEASPLAIRASKQAIRAGMQEPDLERAFVVERALPAVQSLLKSGDRIEGRVAFVEKRAPIWAPLD
ncbi:MULTISPECIES: enoyl-CoA hydratase-related protein [Rhodopseudomonas]|uniref:Enoyl-CoA hydratase n=1 Tax=Rhodopseudomonas palustris TaxID=1076 RepID=A0A0D7E0E0_RHOPL|nr:MULTISPECIES: enoyl-CoA hydratase-related protein [Rhodopseudomonas]KIZ34289.1 enoyl-CoA hydratase [Rhodopseudomonas palustris]MDF3813737.1 enoyl-CoA hydratase-related protein [Rhodopseudomonas sp. BAL398]WOK17625.1 enoyl-CoA hydratase-related protein [Rhodopseudomonas sp. BAL398]